MDLAMLYDVLDVSPEQGPGRLLFTARKAHYTLPYLVLSALEREGCSMSAAARGELARARRRARHYEEVLTRVTAQVPAQVIKGPLLARTYPEGLLRPQGDLDLVTEGEPDLWNAVRLLTEDNPPQYAGVSVLGAPARHVVVTLTWQPEDPLLDPELRVEIATAALVGDQEAVPIRSAMPADTLTANLLALAEERFQRPFHARDAIDVHMLGNAEPPSLDGLVSAAVEYHLAPELRELLDYAAQRVPVGHLAVLGPALEAAEREERARRAARPVSPGPATDVRAALEAGVPLYGMPLGRATGRTDRDRARVHHFGEGALLLTPVGDYLLVTGETVAQEQYDAALREVGLLAEETP
ncbi:nucleotidyltransferase family protein [Streptomyces sp. NBC_00158]|uniref:nucleotidyltransferase family protein n=1 Tax=Streptomyces sp. NBC_00158 TaxID=2903627 RepID=UPI003251F8E4